MVYCYVLFGLNRNVLLDRSPHPGASPGTVEVIQGSEDPGKLSRSTEIETSQSLFRSVSPKPMTTSGCLLKAMLVYGGEERGDG